MSRHDGMPKATITLVRRPVHYRPYDDEPAACGALDTRSGDIPGYVTDEKDEVTCPTCKDELR